MIRINSYHNQGGEVMNKKLTLAAALVFGVAGLILAQGTVKAQMATDNSAMNSTNGENTEMNAENGTMNAAQ
jgi:hypothetical protein